MLTTEEIQRFINEEYNAEFREMQEYRKQCKTLAKAEMGIAE